MKKRQWISFWGKTPHNNASQENLFNEGFRLVLIRLVIITMGYGLCLIGKIFYYFAQKTKASNKEALRPTVETIGVVVVNYKAVFP